MNDLQRIVRMVRSVLARTVESDRRIAAMEFRGKVAVVDGAKHAIRLVIGQTPEGDDVLSPWVPVSQTAGAMKFHDMPSVGQQGVITSASGDIEQARFSPLHWSDENIALSDDPAVKIMQLGDVTVTWDAGSIRAQVGAAVLEITGQGILLDGELVAVTGAYHTHNDTNIGDTHVHGGVTPGGADTAVPH